MSAHQFAASLAAVRSGSGWVARCPAHDDRRPSLSINEGEDGRVLVRCHAGCDQSAVIDALKGLGLWTGSRADSPFQSASARCHRPVAGQSAGTSKAALALWARARPVTGSLAHSYLRARGIDVDPPATLRFLPRARHTPSGQDFPCMVAVVHGAGGDEVIGVQRTFLAPDGSGKAAIEPNKMSLGSVVGGAVRLAAVGERLGLCEGIEDGLSVMQTDPSLPVWATLGTSGLRAVRIPERVRDVVILADGDSAGEHAALFTARRFMAEGRKVRIARPPSPFKDFNDALRCAGNIARAA